MDEFQFKHTIQLSEAEYVRLESSLAHDSSARWGRRLGMGIAAVVLLAWPYTMLVGVAILVLLIISITAPRYYPSVRAREFRHSRYLKEPLTYGVNAERFWVHGPAFRVEADWSHLDIWQVRDEWLVLSGSGLPRVLLPVEQLRAAGLYEQVIAVSDRYGAEFGSQRAMRMSV